MFTTPTKNPWTKKKNSSEYTMLLNVLTAKFDLEKTNHAHAFQILDWLFCGFTIAFQRVPASHLI